MNIASRLLLAVVPLRANLVEVLVVPASTLEAADVIEAPAPFVPSGQRFDAQIERHDTTRLLDSLLGFIHKGGVVVASGIPAYRDFFVAAGHAFGKFGSDGRIGLVSLAPPASGRQQRSSALDTHVHGWVAKCEELMPRAHAGEAWRFARG